MMRFCVVLPCWRDLVKNKKPLKIIYLTDGDAGNIGDTRRRESTFAAKQLGIASTDLIWLGFPGWYFV